MSTPVRVAVVRPYESPRTALIKLATLVGRGFLNAWILMLIIGHLTPWHPSYWATYLVIIAVNTLRGDLSGVTPSWTWQGKKGEAS